MQPEKDPYPSAKEHALKRLERRECSSQDIYQHLIQKKVMPEIATRVVSDLTKLKLINDERFARMLTREQASRGKGPNYIRQKLRNKGVSLNVDQIREISEETTHLTELDAAKAILERRYPRAALDRKEAMRAFQGLLRRGYSFSVTQEALRAQKCIEDKDI